MVWPSWYTGTIVEVVVLENLASIVHFLFAVLVAAMGCSHRVFVAYTFYQLVTTILKTATDPSHGLSDWSWDFVGDTLEYVMGVGVAQLAGWESRLASKPRVQALCTGKSILAGLTLLMLVWLILFLSM